MSKSREGKLCTCKKHSRFLNKSVKKFCKSQQKCDKHYIPSMKQNKFDDRPQTLDLIMRKTDSPSVEYSMSHNFQIISTILVKFISSLNNIFLIDTVTSISDGS